jgi:hypothetical protein
VALVANSVCDTQLLQRLPLPVRQFEFGIDSQIDGDDRLNRLISLSYPKTERLVEKSDKCDSSEATETI